MLLAILAHAKENAITFKEKRISHNWEFIHIVALGAGFFISGWYGLWPTAITYIALRIALFGPIFGLLTTGDYTRLSDRGYDGAMQWLLKIEERKDVKFPAYTIWLGVNFAFGLFIDFALVYLL
jgi:hypothetical protein